MRPHKPKCLQIVKIRIAQNESLYNNDGRRDDRPVSTCHKLSRYCSAVRIFLHRATWVPCPHREL